MEHQGNRVEFDLNEVETYTVNKDQLVVVLKEDFEDEPAEDFDPDLREEDVPQK